MRFVCLEEKILQIFLPENKVFRIISARRGKKKSEKIWRGMESSLLLQPFSRGSAGKDGGKVPGGKKGYLCAPRGREGKTERRKKEIFED